MKKFSFLLILNLFFSIAFLSGQPVEKFIKVIVAPDHSDWMYKKGEPVKFTISVLKTTATKMLVTVSGLTVFYAKRHRRNNSSNINTVMFYKYSQKYETQGFIFLFHGY